MTVNIHVTRYACLKLNHKIKSAWLDPVSLFFHHFNHSTRLYILIIVILLESSD